MSKIQICQYNSVITEVGKINKIKQTNINAKEHEII